ncbi:MAG: UDP-N-acetylmuramoyl-tripeptide--D-alanyl-D-alanine ligase, partial [bacterium]|nr:UDP-N-acetylmuramoyl-tripeptide--D-alanyl-D-alanine ligase [bacterium]
MKPRRIIYLEKILRFFSKVILWKYKPTIVGITGSVGKTSTKEAVFLALSSKFKVRKNEKNYNNEIGIPLTIIGVESGNRSIFGWIKVFLKWLSVVIFPIDYPKILVLEMGADRPGDIEYLLSFIKPAIGIITAISESHLEFFKSIDHIAKEKRKLIKNLPSDGMAILNGDNEKILALKNATSAPMIFFGSGENSQFRFSDISFNYNGLEPQGISFKLNYDGKVMPIRLPNVLAPHLIYATLAAIATGVFFKINLIKVAKALEEFTPPCGRMNLISGKNDSFIIDDTYNSSPVSALAA